MGEQLERGCEGKALSFKREGQLQAEEQLEMVLGSWPGGISGWRTDLIQTWLGDLEQGTALPRPLLSIKNPWSLSFPLGKTRWQE